MTIIEKDVPQWKSKKIGRTPPRNKRLYTYWKKWHLKTAIAMLAENFLPGYDEYYRNNMGRGLTQEEQMLLYQHLIMMLPWLPEHYTETTGKPLTADIVYQRLDRMHRKKDPEHGGPTRRVAAGEEHYTINKYLRESKGKVQMMIGGYKGFGRQWQKEEWLERLKIKEQ